MAQIYVNFLTDWNIPEQLKFIEIKIYSESQGSIGDYDSQDVLVREIYQDLSQITIQNSGRTGLNIYKELRIAFNNLSDGRYKINCKLFDKNYSQFDYKTQLVVASHTPLSIDFRFDNAITQAFVEQATGGFLGGLGR